MGSTGDGAGGGGGGGGFPGGNGGFWGCGDLSGSPGSGYPASGGANGVSAVTAINGTLPFTKTSNAAGVGAGGGTASPACGAVAGQPGRITIWSSTGTKTVFDALPNQPSTFQWVVQ
jgi:hypothetical protein